MVNKIFKALVDLMYGTQRKRRNFEKENPNEKVLAADASKGIVTNGNQGVQRGMEWINSQRAVILLTDKRIICGKWNIPLETISDIKLLKVSSLFMSGQILKIQTSDNEFYQFGMQTNPEWTSQQHVTLNIEKGRITYSVFSIIVRLVAIGIILYWVYVRFFANAV